MLAVKLYILPGLLAGLGALLAGLFLQGHWLRRYPMMFAQATLVEIRSGTVSFRLFDGQILHLRADRRQLAHLTVGDYGRLTYQAGRFLKLE